MNKSILYILSFLVLAGIVTTLIENYQNRKFKEKIDRLEKERSQLRKERAEYFYIIDSLSNEIDTYIERIDSLNTKVDSIKKIRHEIPVIVDSMPIVQVDSILSGYVHPR